MINVKAGFMPGPPKVESDPEARSYAIFSGENVEIEWQKRSSEYVTCVGLRLTG